MALIDDIQKDLRTTGSSQARVDTDDEADQWRRAARAAARRLGRPVQTLQQEHVVVAALRDWPANELERGVTDAKMRSAMNKLAISLSGSTSR